MLVEYFDEDTTAEYILQLLKDNGIEEDPAEIKKFEVRLQREKEQNDLLDQQFGLYAEAAEQLLAEGLAEPFSDRDWKRAVKERAKEINFERKQKMKEERENENLMKENLSNEKPKDRRNDSNPGKMSNEQSESVKHVRKDEL